MEKAVLNYWWARLGSWIECMIVLGFGAVHARPDIELEAGLIVDRLRGVGRLRLNVE
jgi:hypothetical protein